MPITLKMFYSCIFFLTFIAFTSGNVLVSVATPRSQAVFGSKSNAKISKQKLQHFVRSQGGQYLINVYVNGEGPYRFMIDTGASRSSMFETTRRKLGIVFQTSATGKRQETYVNGMSGAKHRPTVKIDNIRFLGRNLSSQKMVVLRDWTPDFSSNAPKFDGILGMDVLTGLILAFEHQKPKGNSKENHKQRKKNDIDHLDEGVVKILPPRKLSQKRYRHWLRLNLLDNPYPVKKYGLLYTYSRFGRLNIPTLVDTGANFTVMDWDIIKGTKYYSERKRLHQEWIVQGATGSFNPKRRIILERFNFGGLILKNHEVLLADLDELPINDFGKYPMLIVGVDAFHGKDFILDLEHKALLLQRGK